MMEQLINLFRRRPVPMPPPIATVRQASIPDPIVIEEPQCKDEDDRRVLEERERRIARRLDMLKAERDSYLG